MKLYYILLLIISPTAVFSQSIEKTLDSIQNEYFKDSLKTGLAVGIINKDSTTTSYFGGKYYADKKDIDSNSIFEIGSITKLYTGFIFQSLVNENKINSNDKLSKYLPEIEDTLDWKSKVRLIDLMTHTSGFPSFDSTKSLENLEGYDENDPYKIFTHEFILDQLNKIDSVPDYGTITYSNFGIGVLALALEKATNISFENLFEKYINNELQLSNTHLELNENQVINMALPHRSRELMPIINLSDLKAAGAIKTNLPDLLKFLNLYINPAVKLKTIVRNSLTDQLPDKEENVGIGWGIFDRNGLSLRFHNGGTYGSSSIVILVPQSRTAVAILSNDADNGTLTSIALKLIETLNSEL